MRRFLKPTRPVGQLRLWGGLVLILALSGCTHLDEGAITVNCDGSQGSSGRGGCATQAPSGEQVGGVTCSGGLVCSNNGAACSRTTPVQHCATIMPAGGTLCACSCL